jgi:uncharacterized damage-inducible protein DinB
MSFKLGNFTQQRLKRNFLSVNGKQRHARGARAACIGHFVEPFKITNSDTTLPAMKKYFLKLYQYNAWANRRVLDTLVRQQVHDEKILSLMGHIVAAQFLWLHRIKGLPAPDVKLWGDYKLEKLQSMAEEAGRQWLEFVENTNSFDREMTYHNYVGDPYTNNVEMVMMHLVNHSTYHRAQIAMLLRQKGYEPINTDFITYDRVLTGQLKE